MCSSAAELVACLETAGAVPDTAAQMGDYLVSMAALLERASVLYVEAVGWFDAFGLAKADGRQGSTQTWLQDVAGRSPRQAAGDRRLAGLLHGDEERPLLATNAALAAGEITLEQARLIAAAMHPLEPATVQRIEATLVEAVASAAPGAAGTLCAHAAELAGPQDAHSRAEEQARRRHLDFHPQGTMVGVRGLLSPSDAEVVSSALAPLAQPQPDPEAADGKDSRSAGQRRVDALVELARRSMVAGELPIHGGDRPQVHLTIDITDLATAPGSAQGGVGRSGGGSPVPAWEARMTCCDPQITAYAVRPAAGAPAGPGASGGSAGRWRGDVDQRPVDPTLLARLLDQIAPALGGTTLEVLALGRSKRLVSPALRKFVVLRDRGCAFPGCDRSHEWCECHHNTTHWIDGGLTEPDNIVLICTHHHRLLHQRNEALARGSDGHWHVVAYQGDQPQPQPHPTHDTLVGAA